MTQSGDARQVLPSAIRSLAKAMSVVAILGAATAHAQQAPSGYEAVAIDVTGPKAARLTAYLRRPSGNAPAPAILALHGCGGLFNAKGQLARREADWSERLTAAGYAVLLLDSFNPRGYRQICSFTGSERPVRPADRAVDADAALSWLTRQPQIDSTRLAVIGWSNGGSTVLNLVDQRRRAHHTGPLPTVAIAFYPGCRPLATRTDYEPAAPLTILIGSDDDWTPPEPCRVLAARPNVRLIEYPGAVHGFDAPNSPRRTRRNVGISARGDGTAQIGTDPAAREAAIDSVQGILAKALGQPPAR